MPNAYQAPLHCGATLPVVARAVLANRAQIDRPGRAWLGAAASLAIAPWRATERVAVRRRLDRVHVQPPIIVVGHWRSGTTYLHELLSQDPRFGFVSGLQAFHPSTSVLGRHTAARMAERLAPPNRPLDNMAAGPRHPQEDEFAVAALTYASFYHAIPFRRRELELFDRFGSFETARPQDIANFAAAWRSVLEKATLLSDGRRLVLKNPVAMARMPLLRKLAPGARFVHIHRHPYEVLPSAVHAARVSNDYWGLQKIDDGELRAGVVALYRRAVHKYFEDRKDFADNEVVDLSFDDLLADPHSQLQHIYDTLDLGPYEPAQSSIAQHVSSQRTYRRNDYALTQHDRELVAREWGFAAQAWGYPL
ncbi:sulfotransferase family protein [Antrihabitans cavernicola]|uniref:Sulfotransferase n=1 Tax=Antrihabitans cavernicola TaxID=2495913 RepID=A0A5A7S574_9NOCA|nr:sulfotransferase [Spelaeibacter cavernicola]KAA0016514.1 sulfotransferase [Spelaeibacter cavernicola]